MEKDEKKSVHRKRRKTHYDYIRLAIFAFVIGGFLCVLGSQQLRLMSIRKETAQCKKEIALQKKEFERQKQKAQHSSSKEFYEEKARDEGYVLENETVFIVGN